MKFIANENIPIEVVNNLRKAGYGFIRIDEVKKGLSDIEIVQLAEREKGILITFDKDFGELVFRRKMRVSGIILLKIRPQNVFYIFEKIFSLLNSKIELKGNFVVVEDDKVRVRKIF